MNLISRIIEKFRKRDRRRKERKESPKLAAYFWTNARPVKQAVRDVSPTGFYLVTEERWYPGTLVMMTLQTEDAEKKSVAVQSKAVRWGDDGVGLMFILPDKGETLYPDDPSKHAANEKTLAAFLESFLKPKGETRD